MTPSLSLGRLKQAIKVYVVDPWLPLDVIVPLVLRVEVSPIRPAKLAPAAKAEVKAWKLGVVVPMFYSLVCVSALHKCHKAVVVPTISEVHTDFFNIAKLCKPLAQVRTRSSFRDIANIDDSPFFLLSVRNPSPRGRRQHPPWLPVPPMGPP